MASDQQMLRWQIWIAARREAIQSIRRALETASVFDERKKIIRLSESSGREFVCLDEPTNETNEFYSALPTIFYLNTQEQPQPREALEAVKSSCVHEALRKGTATLLATEITDGTAVESVPRTTCTQTYTNPLRAVISDFLFSLPASLLSHLAFPNPITALLSASSWSYQIYPPLLLLSVSTFSSPEWQTFLSSPALADRMTELYTLLCRRLNITHVAINAPIPQTTSPTSTPAAHPPPTLTAPSSDDNQSPFQDKHDNNLNLLRSPISLLPLHGSFGSPSAPANRSLYISTLWATAYQNGIYQVFAPLHTMFSRGNIKEKARVLTFPNLEQRQDNGEEGLTAVDLYAGIGYFAFSYRKAGAKSVLGWEINPWSVEGFRRGAERNKWSCRVVGQWKESEEGEGQGERKEGRDDGQDGTERKQTRRLDGLVIFEESNRFASGRVERLRREGRIPPVRHVNCGYLPSSGPSWKTAVECLDPVEGGWVHAHENVGAGDIEEREAEVVERFRELVIDSKRFGGLGTEIAVKCEHMEKVKTYAPGVVHCVFDIYIQPNLCS